MFQMHRWSWVLAWTRCRGQGDGQNTRRLDRPWRVAESWQTWVEWTQPSAYPHKIGTMDCLWTMLRPPSVAPRLHSCEGRRAHGLALLALDRSVLARKPGICTSIEGAL